jgi:ribosome-associated protein
MSLDTAEFLKLAIFAARSLDAKSGQDILLLDMRKTPMGLCDFILMVTGLADSHLKTLKETVEEAMSSVSLNPTHRDGVRGGPWVVLDYGGLIVHIFDEKTRAFYNLERQWISARPIDWRVESPSGKKAAKPKPKVKVSSKLKPKRKTLPKKKIKK